MSFPSEKSATRMSAILLGSASLMALSLISAPAHAEETGQVLEEIMVTAQKRSESLQTVPVPVTALGGEQLARMGADEFRQYARSVPSLSFVDRGPGRTKIVIRGISTGINAENSATVGVYIDEMPVGSSFASPSLRLFDIDRVEILRGPQGTLYGEGSMGGTIKVITNQPDSQDYAVKFDGGLSTTRKGGENYNLNGMVNVPLIQDKLGLRVVGFYRHGGGFIDNAFNGRKDINTEETFGGRMAARLQATDELALTFTVNHQDSDIGGTQEVNLGANLQPTYGDLTQYKEVEEPYSDKFTQYNALVEYDFGWANLTSSSSWFDRTVWSDFNVTGLLPWTSLLYTNTKTKKFVQEVRLTSPNDQKIEWIVGGFYSKTDGTIIQTVNADELGPDANPILDSLAKGTDKQRAIFGELTYNFTDQFSSTLGGRYFEITNRFTSVADGLLAGGYSEDAGKAKETGFNPKLQLSFQANEDLLLFAVASKGFREGGAQGFVPPSPSDPTVVPNQFKSDNLWNYEVGLKSSWLDKRVTFNLALYYIDWTDIQVRIRRADGFNFVDNAGKATSKGVELETAVRPIAGLDLRFGGSYNDVALEEDAPSLYGVKGDRVPGVPKWSLNGSAQYSFAATDALGAYVRADVQYTGSSLNAFNSDTTTPGGAPKPGTAIGLEQKGYALVGLRAGIEADHWEFAVYAENLFDKRANVFIDTATLAGTTKSNVNQPRTIGVNIRTQF